MHRNVCESCGAPLRKTGIRGKYICDYCHTEYYDDSYTDDPVPEIVEQPIVTPINPKKKMPTLILLAGILGFGIFACLMSPVLLSNSTNTQLRTKISTPIMLNVLPEAVKAGTPVAYRWMEILLSPELTVENQAIYLKLSIQNWEDQTTVFRYRPNQLILYDDLGNRYNLVFKNCDLDIPYQDRQITFEPGEQIDFESVSYWCRNEDTLPAFSGVIPIEANNLYLKFKNFGVFQNITFVIEL